jgi:hypothetical protein
MFDATQLSCLVTWSNGFQRTSVASCYIECQSGYLIVRPRIHPPVQSSPPDLYFQSATCHGSVILVPFTALFPNVPSRRVPKPISHTQTLDFQLGDSTQGVEGIRQYTISSMEQVEAERVGSETLVSKPIAELSCN